MRACVGRAFSRDITCFFVPPGFSPASSALESRAGAPPAGYVIVSSAFPNSAPPTH